MKKFNILSAGLALFAAATISSCSSISDTEYEINGVKFKMLAVEGGSFMMGATPGQSEDASKSAHKVTVDDFFIGETEVTQELWFAVMGNNPSNFKNNEGNYPVENVSWNDVQVFIKKLNDITGMVFRLPFEAEWEYAARGGKKSINKKYAGSDSVDEVSWYKDNSGSKTHVVAGKKANELGLYDILGNVMEWNNSWENPDFCILRGTGFENPSKDNCNYRYKMKFGSKHRSIGFRLAL